MKDIPIKLKAIPVIKIPSKNNGKKLLIQENNFIEDFRIWSDLEIKTFLNSVKKSQILFFIDYFTFIPKSHGIR